MERKLVPLLIAIWLGCIIVSNRKVLGMISLVYAAIKVA